MQPDLAALPADAPAARPGPGRLGGALLGALGPGALRGLVLAAPGVAVAPPPVRLLAWSHLAAQRGARVDERRVRYQIALAALGAAVPRPGATMDEVLHMIARIDFMERARDRIDLPAGEVTP